MINRHHCYCSSYIILRRLFFFQGPFGRDIKTTVKIRNILIATFSHTYQLLLYIVDAPTQTFFVSWYQLSNTLVIEANRLCFQPILQAGLQLIVPKSCPPTTVSYEETDKNHGRMTVGDQTLPIENAQEPLCCSYSVRPSIVMKKDIT